MKRFFTLLVFAIVSMNLCSAQDVKNKTVALYLYNFTKNIEWPASDKNGDFIICVVNQKEVVNQIKSCTNGKTVGTQPITVVSVSSIEDVSKCHILYLPTSESKADKLESVISKLSGSSTLIVTDRPGSLKNGSSINFLLVDDKVRIEISKQSVTEKKLQVSSQLINMSVTPY